MTDLLCLTVTKDRPHFMPWLIKVFHELHWPWGEKKLMVFVDGPAHPYAKAMPSGWLDKTLGVVSIHAGFVPASLGDHRQHALEVACSTARYDAGLNSTWITWMDDDDWRHPHSVRYAMQAAKHLAYSDKIQLVIPRCKRNALIQLNSGHWAETSKAIHWYETLIRADLALELEPFMPVSISEDYYWHQNAVSLAQSKGPEATHVEDWPYTAYSSANLIHTNNTAGNAFENAFEVSVRTGWLFRNGNKEDVFGSSFPLDSLLALNGGINARTP